MRFYLLPAACYLLLVSLIGLLAGVAFAETTALEVAPYGMVLKPAANLPGLEKQISIDLRETNVVDVLKFLATKSGVNIVAAPGIEGRVTLFLKEVTIEDALQIVLLSTGLAYRQHQNILYIMTEEAYAGLYGEAYRDQRILRIIPLRFANPATAATFLGNVKSTVGKIIADEGTATLVLIDVPEKITVMEEMIKNLDLSTVVRQIPMDVRVFEPHYAKVNDIQSEVARSLTPAGKIQVDQKSNTLVVSDVESQMPILEKVVRAFDRKPRQVFIETKMVQVRLEDRYFMGINWDELSSNELVSSLQTDIDFPISTSATTLGAFTVGNLAVDGYNAIIKGMQKFGNTETIAGPQLAVVDGEEATILIGTREAYVTSTVSQAQSTTTTSEDITFIDVGVKLKVKPEISKERFVKLTVTPEVSTVGRTLTTANKNQIPIVDTTNTTTTVIVKDGHMVLMGGLIKDEIVKDVTKVPLFGDIPLLGSIFRNIDDKRVKTELVIFLTPHIITGDEENPFLSASGKEFYPLRHFPEKVPGTFSGKKGEKVPGTFSGK